MDSSFAVTAALMSPHFLFHIVDDSTAKPGESYKLDSYQLASRLSFFLWGSIPDQTLLDAAKRGELAGSPQTLAAQVRRMLADKRAEQQPIPVVTLPMLDQVIAAIEAATDADSMAHAKQLGAQMADGPEKDQAVEAYKRRVAALKAAAEQQTVDPETGEVQRDEWLEGYEAAEVQQ